jgi:diguanylate cyclase
LQTAESNRVLQAFQKLFDWTAGLADDVSQYRTVVNSLAAQFSDVRDAEESQENPAYQRAAASSWLQQIMAANEGVQQRLAAAETRLQQQAIEIASYVSEARTDSLTGLANRRAFDEELARRLADWRRHGVPVSVLIVDVDDFKRFNDRHGHLVGDAVLHAVARTLNGAMRESDLTTRFGGEEFAVVLPNTSIAEAGQAAERARLAIQQHVVRYENRSLQVTVSCGAAQALQGEHSASLINRADAALYCAKKSGRNAAYWHDGHSCLPLGIETPIGREAMLGHPGVSLPQSVSEDFGQLCGDLRRCLKEFVAQDSAPP